MNLLKNTGISRVVFPSMILPFMFSILFLSGCSPAGKQVEADFYASIETDQNLYYISEGRRLILPVSLKNQGRLSWSSEDSPPVFLSYHLYDSEGRLLRFDNPRTVLPGAIDPGRSAEIPLKLRAPLNKGLYHLELDLVREGTAWFSDGGSPTPRISLEVTANNWPGLEGEFSLEKNGPTRFETESEELNTLYKLIRLTLDQNLVRFQGRHGEISGFSAGTDYPQIWIRDASTIIPASRMFYDQAVLTSWLEEHLRYQQENGALYDWLDSSGRTEKNTVETDQESSAVLAAHQIFEILGPSWLEKDIDGIPILSRLADALLSVWKNRRSTEFGLIIGAHTADWGDVDMVDEGAEATDVGDNTHWTADIYDQSMFYDASQKLGVMLEAAGRTDEALEWEKRAASIRLSTNRLLWMEDKGFFKVHIHLDDLRHDFDEEDMFAMGGNACALVSGLADPNQSARIIRTALERQARFQISTISGTLLPPYPKGTFRHPLMDDPFEYQNGAQWDWFGGRLVLAMFQRGYSRKAKEKLLEIIRKNIANGGFFEWDSREGIGRGSDYYSGSAGILAQAVVEGYFGLNLTKDRLQLTSRLGADSGKIKVSLPASGSFAAYDYRFIPRESRIMLQINSSIEGSGLIRLLSPWEDLKSGKSTDGNSFKVRIDGRPVPFRLAAVSEDIYIGFETDFGKHTISIVRN